MVLALEKLTLSAKTEKSQLSRFGGKFAIEVTGTRVEPPYESFLAGKSKRPFEPFWRENEDRRYADAHGTTLQNHFWQEN